MPSQDELHTQVAKLHEKVDSLTKAVEGLLHGVRTDMQELLERTKHLGGRGGPGAGSPPPGSAG